MNASEDKDDSLPNSVAFVNFDEAWHWFTQLEVTDWKHLPFPGSLSEQPEALWNDIMQCAMLASKIRKAMGTNN